MNSRRNRSGATSGMSASVDVGECYAVTVVDDGGRQSHWSPFRRLSITEDGHERVADIAGLGDMSTSARIVDIGAVRIGWDHCCSDRVAAADYVIPTERRATAIEHVDVARRCWMSSASATVPRLDRCWGCRATFPMAIVEAAEGRCGHLWTSLPACRYCQATCSLPGASRRLAC
jgi:hypothetical protein